MWKNIVEHNRSQIIRWRMSLACWIPKATNTHSQYVILIAVPVQRQFHERPSMLCHTYISCLVNGCLWTWKFVPRCQEIIIGAGDVWWRISLRRCATSRRVASSIPAGIIRIFFIDLILPTAIWSWSRLNPLQKWTPGMTHDGKDGRSVGPETLPLSCADCLKNSGINVLES